MAIAEDDGWIPCYKEKPPIGIPLLVTFQAEDNRYVDLAIYDPSGDPRGRAWIIVNGHFTNGQFINSDECIRTPLLYGTHWRRIPEPAVSMEWWKEGK